MSEVDSVSLLVVDWTTLISKSLDGYLGRELEEDGNCAVLRAEPWLILQLSGMVVSDVDGVGVKSENLTWKYCDCMSGGSSSTSQPSIWSKDGRADGDGERHFLTISDRSFCRLRSFRRTLLAFITIPEKKIHTSVSVSPKNTNS